MAGRYDVLWKGMLEEVCEDLLRFIFPDVEENLDLIQGFEFLDKEMGALYPEPEKQTNTRVVDNLVKVHLKNGGERWMLLHVEVQGWNDPEFAKRMFTYYYRILDRHNHQVTAVAIFTGKDGKKMPDRYEDNFMGTHAVYRYNTLCITDYKDEDLQASNNPFALIVLAAKKRLLKQRAGQSDEEWDMELLKQKMLISRLLHEKGIFPERKIAIIISFLHNYIQFKRVETNRIFMKQLDDLIGKENTMGYFEQLAQLKAQEAREEGEVKVKQAQEKSVKAFLSNTEFSTDKIASLIGVSVEFVEQVRKGM
jgi:transcription initiation factor TFIIIB Brf1 subunit/transcription initiation factor TFIIB